VVSLFQMFVAAPKTLTVVVPTTPSEPPQYRGNLRRLEWLLLSVYIHACFSSPSLRIGPSAVSAARD